jgi:type II secretory pathway component PulK
MPPSPQNPEHGSVLILALWTLFFLAALALAVGAHVSAGLRLAGAMRQDARGYHLARAGVTHAALAVACNTNQWDGWGDGAWNSDPERFSGQVVGDEGRFSIVHRVQGEDGVVENVGLIGAESRLNISPPGRARLNKSIFTHLLVRVGGVSEGRAEDLYDALHSYREAKQQRLLTIRTARGYPEADSCGEAALDTVHELLLVEGMDDSLFALIEPYVTVFGNGRINANTASVELLLACAEAFEAARQRIEEIIAEREGGAALQSVAELSNIAFLTVRSTAFYGIAIGETATGGSGARIAFVVDSTGYRRYWHEF